MQYPKISVVTPSYNQAEYLEQTILSIVSQNYPNLEYIIIDGGSADRSVEVIKKYEHHISYWVSEKDGGMYDAIQKGLIRSTGEIMCWLNSDDVFVPYCLFTVAEIFSKYSQVNWLMGSPSYIDEQGKMIEVQPLQRWSRLRFLMKDYAYIHQSSTFWRRSLWEKSGAKLDVKSQLAGDFELWLRFFRFDQLYTTSGVLASHRSRSKEQKSLESLQAYTDEVMGHLNTEPCSEQEKRRINNVKRADFLLKYLNFQRLKNFRFKQFEYPPALFYNVIHQCWQMEK